MSAQVTPDDDIMDFTPTRKVPRFRIGEDIFTGVLEIPAEWTEVLIRFSLIWMVFMGIPYAFRAGAMVSVDVLARWVSPLGKRILSFCTCVAALILVVTIIWWGWDYATRGRMQSVIGLEGVTMFWAYLALPVGGLFCIPAIVAQFFDPQNSELEAAQ